MPPKSTVTTKTNPRRAEPSAAPAGKAHQAGSLISPDQIAMLERIKSFSKQAPKRAYEEDDDAVIDDLVDTNNTTKRPARDQEMPNPIPEKIYKYEQTAGNRRLRTAPTIPSPIDFQANKTQPPPTPPVSIEKKQAVKRVIHVPKEEHHLPEVVEAEPEEELIVMSEEEEPSDNSDEIVVNANNQYLPAISAVISEIRNAMGWLENMAKAAAAAECEK